MYNMNNNYEKDAYFNNITSYFSEGVQQLNQCNDASFNPIACKNHISNNIKQIEYDFIDYNKVNNKIDENYKTLNESVLQYNKLNKARTNQPNSYEVIDDKGTLFADKERGTTVTDARNVDSRDLLLEQNKIHIVCSLVISSILIFSIIIQ